MLTACDLCGDPTEDRYLCDRHTAALALTLDRLPKLYTALEGFLAPAVHGSPERVSSGEAAASLPVNEAVLDLRHTGIVLVLEGWRADVQRARGWGEPAVSGTIEHRVMAAARWLGMTLDWIAAAYPAAGDLAREVREMEGAALSVIGALPDRGKLIGRCVSVDAEGAACGAPIRHKTGETALTCSWCGCQYATEQDWLLLSYYQPAATATPASAGVGEAHPSRA
ncbi:hypothetical protein ACFXAZ_12105 [Streptomyces sp. NPDC059477]|uniref:hypothetical protein n=1 Tax=Streptomyces sp. NPDC059477 TaxID=3346847 RepID=UPI003688B3C8